MRTFFKSNQKEKKMKVSDENLLCFPLLDYPDFYLDDILKQAKEKRIYFNIKK
jgi:hypothetical protein